MKRLLLMLLMLSQAASANPMWEQWKADQAFRQGRYKEAITGYQRALKQADSPRLRYNLALAQVKAGDLKNARTGFTEVLEGDDLALRGKAAYNLGNMAYKQEKLEEALDFYKKALRYDEKDEDARHNAWIVLQKLKQKQQQKKNDKSQKDQDQKDDKSDQDKKNDKSDQDKKDDKSGQGDQDKKNDKSGKGDQDKKNDKSGQGDQDKKDDKSGQGDQDKKDDKSGQGDQDKKNDKSGQGDQDKKNDKSGQGGQDKKDQAGSPEAAARARKQEAEQLLHFFEEKEKQETGQRARARGMRAIPQTGGQTW
ncbi:tetratricopeptide repeat protein [bacterium CPR1]|nr:tetratricopeptide repeat protein [bacterium CPR1]